MGGQIIRLGLLGGGLLDPRSERWAHVRGAVTLYMAITGIVYAALLSTVDVQLAAPWTNSVLHRVLPLLVLADWLFFPPWTRASRAKALAWLAFVMLAVGMALLALGVRRIAALRLQSGLGEHDVEPDLRPRTG